MKHIFKTAMVITLVLTMLLSLSSCGLFGGTKTHETEHFSIELPGGFSKLDEGLFDLLLDIFLDEEDVDVEDLGIYYSYTEFLGDNLITIYYEPRSDWYGVYYGGIDFDQDSSQADFKQLLIAVEESVSGTLTEVTVGEYLLYEYEDIMDSTALVYYHETVDGFWIIDISIGNDEYEEFKEKVPAILDSFKVK